MQTRTTLMTEHYRSPLSSSRLVSSSCILFLLHSFLGIFSFNRRTFYVAIEIRLVRYNPSFFNSKCYELQFILLTFVTVYS